MAMYNKILICKQPCKIWFMCYVFYVQLDSLAELPYITK